MIYDDVLNVTWLQDANFVKSSGYDIDGYMTWSEASAWAANLSYYDSVRNAMYADWRLPTVRPINGGFFNGAFSYNGTTDYGYNISALGTLYAGSTASELAYMFYINLGNKGYFDAAGNVQSGYGLANSGLFNNVGFSYWSDTEDGASYAWRFVLTGGYQDSFYKDLASNSAWAVRDGDVARARSVPEPTTIALMGLGLAGLRARRKS